MSSQPLPFALTCDFWNTLVEPDKGQLWNVRRAAVAEILAEYAFTIADDVLDERLAVAGRQQHVAWTTGVPHTPVLAAEAVANELGLQDGPLREALLTAYLGAGADADLQLAPGVEPALQAIAAAGVRLGIICDVGLTGSGHLRAFLDRAELLGLFHSWSFSDEVGAFKPSPVIFDHALAGLGASDPSRCFHIGDLLRTDVAGARAAGMVSIRYTALAEDPTDAPEADHVATDWAQVPALLGVLGAADATAAPSAAS